MDNSPPSSDLLMFFEEATERLDEADRSLLHLEEAVIDGVGDASDYINVLFRAVHTIKGNAGIMDLSAVVEVAHVLETLMDKVRAGQITPDRKVLDLVFMGLDLLREMIIVVYQGGDEHPDTTVFLTEIQAVLSGHSGARKAEVKDIAGRFTGWEMPETGELIEALIELDNQQSELFRLVFPYRKADVAHPLTHPDFMSLNLFGYLIGWRWEGEDQLQLAFVAKLTLGEVEQIVPSNVVSCDAWPAAAIAPEAPAVIPVPVVAEASAQVPEAVLAVPVASAKPAEAKVSKLPSSEPMETSIRVAIPLVDKLLNLVGELVLNRNQILQHVRKLNDQSLMAPVQRLNLITTELQEAIMKTRLQPIRGVWDRFPRLVRDYCRSGDKSIELVMEGADTELDRSLLEVIRDPMTHILRNAMDHGLEPAGERVLAGKPAQGTIKLVAYQDGGQIIIEVHEDGRGFNLEKIHAKALNLGLYSAEVLGAMTETELMQLVFHPGFSTAEAISNISGRGVGMDVVKTNIERIGGSVEIFSSVGKGTMIKIRIPLTLAVLPALIVHAGKERFAIPQSELLEVVRTGDGLQRIEQLRESMVFRLRNTLIPVISLRAILGLAEPEGGEDERITNLVILHSGSQVFGLAVDEIGDTEEIVVKPLHQFLQAIHTYSGVTILGNGHACLILDIGGLLKLGNLSAANQIEESNKDAEVAGSVKGDVQQMLLCKIGGDHTYAIPLALVSRLEVFPPEALEYIGARRVIQYAGEILPVLDFESILGISSEVTDGQVHVVVVGVGERQIGLQVSEILDIIEDRLMVHPVHGADGILGAAVIGKHTTEILDVHNLIEQRYPDWFKTQNSAAKFGPKAILLVEDSSFFRGLLRSHLEGIGYHVVEAEDGEIGLTQLAANPIDIVLSDIEMPNMDGLAMVRRIRQNPQWKELPCIALTTRGSSEDRQLGVSAGFNSYLTKYDRQAVLETLASYEPGGMHYSEEVL